MSNNISLLMKRFKTQAAKLRTGLLFAIFILTCLIVQEIIGLGRVGENRELSVQMTSINSSSSHARNTDELLSHVGQRHLFEPAIPLPARRVANESVQRIKERLSLHGIMKLGNELVAYIKVKDESIRPYHVGESYEDLFKVTSIENRTVEIEVAGERIDLEM